MIQERMQLIAREMEVKIKAKWPVDTGRSRDGIRVIPSQTAFIIENDMPYSRYVHYSGSTDRAIDVIMRDLKPEVDKLITKAIEAEMSEVLNNGG